MSYPEQKICSNFVSAAKPKPKPKPKLKPSQCLPFALSLCICISPQVHATTAACATLCLSCCACESGNPLMNLPSLLQVRCYSLRKRESAYEFVPFLHFFLAVSALTHPAAGGKLVQRFALVPSPPLSRTLSS